MIKSILLSAAFVCALFVGHGGTLAAQSLPTDSGSAVPASGTGTAPASATAKSDATPTTIPGIQQRNPRYRLRKGDSFDVDFTFSPEFNQTVAVQPDGFVTLKEVGSIYVEGQTVPELTQTLK